MKSFNNSYKLFAGFLALVLVAGMSTPAFAGMVVFECIIEPALVKVQISEKDGSVFVEKKITCDGEIKGLRLTGVNCENYLVISLNPEISDDMVEFTEQVTNRGPLEEEHCEVEWEITAVEPVITFVDQELWINIPDDRPIGGTVGSLDTATLLVAGAQANMGLWSLALVGMVAAGAAIIYKTKSKKTEQ